MEDREAIQALKRGDLGGLEHLVRAYQVRAIRAAYLVTHDLATAQDVAQDGFLKVHDRIEQIDDHRPFGPWFLTILLRDAVKAARKRGRLSSLDEAIEAREGVEPADGAPGPEALWEAAETADEVRSALRGLTARQRAAVVARYYLGMTQAEMALALECTASTVKWRLYSARQRLRLLLSPSTGDLALKALNGGRS